MQLASTSLVPWLAMDLRLSFQCQRSGAIKLVGDGQCPLSRGKGVIFAWCDQRPPALIMGGKAWGHPMRLALSLGQVFYVPLPVQMHTTQRYHASLNTVGRPSEGVTRKATWRGDAIGGVTGPASERSGGVFFEKLTRIGPYLSSLPCEVMVTGDRLVTSRFTEH